MESIELTFKINNFTFNGKHYLQKHGTAMGPKNACSYADISVSEINSKVLNMNTSNSCAGATIRMIKTISLNQNGLWNGSLEGLRVATSNFWNFSWNIHFEMNYLQNSLANYSDICIIL